MVFAKAGVMLLELQSNTVLQAELDLQRDEAPDRSDLMAAMDELNQRYGRGTVQMASAGLAGDRRAWAMKQERRTPGVYKVLGGHAGSAGMMALLSSTKCLINNAPP